MTIPQISEYMTKTPLTVGVDQPMSLAHELMRSHKVRHLPVLRGGVIVGVVSDRDLHLIETLKDVDPDKVTVEEAMSEAPYCVAQTTPLDQVVTEMAKHKYGCAIVADGAKVLGIVTTVDVCRAFAATLQQR
jgi:acetoin utilization protein AcuB